MKLEGQWKGLTRFTRVKPGEEGPSSGGLGAIDEEKIGATRYDVAELYSPSRITRLAAKRGMRAGWNFDYQHEDPHYRETV